MEDYNFLPRAGAGPAVTYTRQDRRLLPVCLLIGFLLVESTLFATQAGILFSAFGLLMLLATAWYLDIRGRTLLLFLPHALLLLCPVLFCLPRWLVVADVLALLVLYPAACIVATGLGRYPWYRPLFLGDIVLSAIVHPFARMGRAFGALRSTRLRKAMPFAVGFLIAMPVLVLCTSLLSSADLVFDDMMKWAVGSAWDDLWIRLFRTLAISLLPALMLYSWLYAQREGRPAYCEPAKLVRTGGAVGQAYLLGGLAPLAALYGLFAVIQFAYLFGPLQQQMTYSEYARRGFFELTAVAALNMALVQLSMYLLKRRTGEGSRAVRALCFVILGETGIMLVSAVYRMLMYVGVYGLTSLRVLTLVAEAGIGVLIACCAVKVARPAFRTFPWVCGVAVAGLLLCNFININALIRGYNAAAYESGRLQQLDAEYQRRLMPRTLEETGWKGWNIESALRGG